MIDKPKIEYSDLYRFFSSVGLILLGISMIVPWLFLKDLDFMLSNEEYEKLIESSQKLVLLNHRVGVYMFYALPISSGLMIIVGLIISIFGASKWWIKQKNADEMDQIKLIIARTSLPSREQSEVLSEKQEEIINASSSNLSTSAYERLKEKDDTGDIGRTVNIDMTEVIGLMKIEDKIFKKIVEYNSFDYTVKRNVKINSNISVDILLSAISKKLPDKLIEIKYLSSSLNFSHVIEFETYLRNTNLFYGRLYSRSSTYKLIVVYKHDIGNDDQRSRFVKAIKDWNKMNHTSILYLSDKQIDNFDFITTVVNG